MVGISHHLTESYLDLVWKIFGSLVYLLSQVATYSVPATCLVALLGALFLEETSRTRIRFYVRGNPAHSAPQSRGYTVKVRLRGLNFLVREGGL